MASGCEDLELCELAFADGTTIVVEPDARIYRELHAAGDVARSRPERLVTFAWLWIVPIMLVIAVVC